MRKRDVLRALERFAAHTGAPVTRCCLSHHVSGRSERDRILLRRGLSMDDQLITLVHELTHVLAHQNAEPPLNRTVCEYEAEAVEQLVCAPLGIDRAHSHFDALNCPTDDLLPSSVERVVWVSAMIAHVARLTLTTQPALEPKTAI